MNLGAHLAFFLLLSFAIVVMSAFYSEVEDGPALRSVPRRYGVFVGACAVVAAVMLVLEHLFAFPS
ncbi:MAG: hypothetical protein EXS08_14610 [Planctomycetes bacterium]|nr:hypothetical protein [Planctomycetota bacterium]